MRVTEASKYWDLDIDDIDRAPSVEWPDCLHTVCHGRRGPGRREREARLPGRIMTRDDFDRCGGLLVL
jgi:hypothetical protein